MEIKLSMENIINEIIVEVYGSQSKLPANVAKASDDMKDAVKVECKKRGVKFSISAFNKQLTEIIKNSGIDIIEEEPADEEADDAIDISPAAGSKTPKVNYFENKIDGYNVINKQFPDIVIDETSSSKFTSDGDVDKYLKLFLGDDFDEYTQQREVFIELIDSFRKRNLRKRDIPKAFSYIAKGDRCTYKKPVMDGKKEVEKTEKMPEDIAKEIVKYKHYMKSLVIKDKDVTSKDYLLSGILQHPSVINEKFLTTVIPDYKEENKHELFNIIETTSENVAIYKNINEQIDKMNKARVSSPLDYFTMINLLKGFAGGSRIVNKDIYKARCGITEHDHMTSTLKEELWEQAKNNINRINTSGFTGEKCTSGKPTDVTNSETIAIWQELLNSRFVFYIFMYNIPASAHFNKYFESFLLKSEFTFKLFATILYPISFLFTPFAFGSKTFTPSTGKGGDISIGAYRKNLKKEFEELLCTRHKMYNYEDCNWIYYLTSSEQRNNMLMLLSPEIALQQK